MNELNEKVIRSSVVFLLASKGEHTIADICKLLDLPRTSVDRIILPLKKEGVILEKRKKKEGNKIFLGLDKDKSKKDLENFYRWQVITVCDVLKHFYKDRLDEETTVNRILEELK